VQHPWRLCRDNPGFGLRLRQSTLLAKQAYATLELKVAYHSAMTAHTGPVHAVGTLLSMGRRAAFAEARLTDTADKLCASATSTILVF
jgi:uncharacterized protein (TIGR00369 family)